MLWVRMLACQWRVLLWSFLPIYYLPSLQHSYTCTCYTFFSGVGKRSFPKLFQAEGLSRPLQCAQIDLPICVVLWILVYHQKCSEGLKFPKQRGIIRPCLMSFGNTGHNAANDLWCICSAKTVLASKLLPRPAFCRWLMCVYWKTLLDHIWFGLRSVNVCRELRLLVVGRGALGACKAST